MRTRDHSLGWSAPNINAGAAEQLSLNKSYRPAGLRESTCQGWSRLSSTDNDCVEVLSHPSLVNHNSKYDRNGVLTQSGSIVWVCDYGLAESSSIFLMPYQSLLPDYNKFLRVIFSAILFRHDAWPVRTGVLPREAAHNAAGLTESASRSRSRPTAQWLKVLQHGGLGHPSSQNRMAAILSTSRFAPLWASTPPSKLRLRRRMTQYQTAIGKTSSTRAHTITNLPSSKWKT